MSRATTKQVKAIIAKHYPHRFCYNDLRAGKTQRRIKCMTNGYRENPEFYQTAAANIHADLVASGIEFRNAGFKDGACWRGSYIYYAVVIGA